MIAHPECEQHLLDLADFIGSTSMLLNYSQSSEASGFIVLTEPGILHQMRKAVPNKEFHAVPGLDGCSCNACPHMRLTPSTNWSVASKRLSRPSNSMKRCA